MDPITAFANLAAELTKLVNTIVANQPPDVQKQLWEWYVSDMKRWRKFLKLDE